MLKPLRPIQASEIQNELYEYWAALEASVDVSAIWKALADFAGRRRFSSIAYIPFFEVDSAEPVSKYLFCEGAPDKWVQEYYKGQFKKFDPILEYSQRAHAPFRWYAIESLIPLTQKQKRFMRVLREAGLGDGIAIPVFAHAGQNGMLSFGYGAYDDGPSAYDQTWLQWVAQVTHARILALKSRETVEAIRLSPRETEIITLVARGLSNPAIAASLNLSENTVGTHMRRIYRKLDVNARGAAVAKALSYGLLF